MPATCASTAQPVRGVMPQRVGFVFQENALFPWSTVWENLIVGLEFQGVPAPARAARAAHALKMVGMSDFAKFYPDQLSGGMKQRVGLARALALETEVLLMDEPFAALDEQTRMILGEDLSVLLSETGKTIVMVTHSLSEAVFLADRIYVMTARPGRIKAEVAVAREHPRRPDFMTSPQFNDVRAELYTLLHEEMGAPPARDRSGMTAQPCGPRLAFAHDSDRVLRTGARRVVGRNGRPPHQPALFAGTGNAWPCRSGASCGRRRCRSTSSTRWARSPSPIRWPRLPDSPSATS